MQDGEVKAINDSHPFMSTVLRMIGNNQRIEMDNPLFPTYMVARQRGFVERTGETKEQIVVSARGKLFLEIRNTMIGKKHDESD
jgi:hypothetical protein